MKGPAEPDVIQLPTLGPPKRNLSHEDHETWTKDHAGLEGDNCLWYLPWNLHPLSNGNCKGDESTKSHFFVKEVQPALSAATSF